MAMKFGFLLLSSIITLSSCVHFGDRVLVVEDRVLAAQAELLELKDKGFVGSVLVACDDRVIMKEDVGLTPDRRSVVRYEVASISKWITAIATLKLAENGTISLGDPVGAYVPNTPPDKSEVTLFHLLTHQSGLKQTYQAEGHFSAEDAAKAVLTQPLAFPPGTDFSYSNDNFSLLAIVIEEASESTYKDFLHVAITRPLGLMPIAFWPDPLRDGEIWPPLLQDRPMPNQPIDWGFLGGHGARLSVDELHAILIAVERGDLLGRDSLDLLFSDHLVLPSGTGIGMGWYSDTDEEGRRRASTRGQDMSGGNAVVYKIGERGLIIIAATNNGPAENKGPGWSRKVRDAMIDLFAESKAHSGVCDSD